MKILLINYRYYDAGGPERYMFNVTNLLEKNGHTVIPFSLRYSANQHSSYESFFADPPGDDDNFYYQDQKKNLRTVSDLAARQFYSSHVYDKLSSLISETAPDIAYVLHFLRKMSPSVIDACHDNGVPCIVRLSDYALICPKNNMFRQGRICELCQTSLWKSVRHSCIKDSVPASMLNYFAYLYNDMRGIYRKVSSIVCPSQFLMTKFRANPRFNTLSYHHIPTFILDEVLARGQANINRPLSHIVGYWGRITEDKGVDVILKAACQQRKEQSRVRFMIIGNGNPEYVSRLHTYIASNHLDNVEIIDFVKKEKLFDLVSSWDLSLVPSLWYDNMPNSLIESLALAIPVIASDHGSLSELISHGQNGMKIAPGSAEELSRSITDFYRINHTGIAMNERAHRWAISHFSEQTHFSSLMRLFEETTSGKQ